MMENGYFFNKVLERMGMYREGRVFGGFFYVSSFGFF